MNQSIFLPNFNLSLLQSQKHCSNNKLKTNKINISTEIVPSTEQNSFEIKLVVDSPFGQLQISNNIFIRSNQESSTSLTCIPLSDIKLNSTTSEEQLDSRTIDQFLDIYAKANSNTFIRNNLSSDNIEEIEDEDKSKSTAPNSPNQQKYSISSSNSPASTETALDEFHAENTNMDCTETEGTYTDIQKIDGIRSKSQTVLTSSSMSTTSLLLEDDSDECNSANNDDVQATFIKSEKKNSVKNVLKAFGNFIMNMSEGLDDEIIESSSFKSVDDLKKRYLRYNKNQNYNNSLVCKIIQHQQYGIIFKHFITNYAGTWLERSDVGDKASHETFITFCKSACEDHELLNCLKIIKKKHLKLSSC